MPELILIFFVSQKKSSSSLCDIDVFCGNHLFFQEHMHSKLFFLDDDSEGRCDQESEIGFVCHPVILQ